jgi:hypothetical protein
MEGHWTILGATPGANALGRTTGGVAVATGHRIDIRPDSDLTHSGTNTELKWPRTEPNAPVTALDGSVTGKFAFVTSDAKSLDYGLANSTGSVTALAPAPTQSFTPLVAWLDEARVLTLSTDNQQASRLAIVDSSARSIDSLQALAGVRWFGLSSDRHTIAAATESAIYVGTVAAFQAQALPPKAVTLDDLRIAWALALDAGGSMIFMLSGTEAADGTVGAIRELGYSQQGSTWTKVLDSPAPFGRAIAQVCLPA